jgi:site-specific DNA-methyltransferase (adenine-specific)
MADLHHGDCLEVMRTMPDCSFDAVVTDPPYGLSFMGKKWDYDVPSVAIWAECLRVLKPGGHLLAFAGTRTQHRMAVRIEDAGFEIRDMIAWVYGSGFPKSLDVSKAIDKAAGAERTERMKPKAGHENFVGRDNMKAMRNGTMSQAGGFARPWMHDPEAVERAHWDFAPATPEAQQWAGWGTALKPALEPITMARRPLDGTVAANVLEHGTGALNVDGCRVEGMPPSVPQPSFNSPTGRIYGMKAGEGRNGEMSQATGRWPANLIHDGSDEVVGLFPETTSGGGENAGANMRKGLRGNDAPHRTLNTVAPSSGSAARFFYTAKASRDDRDDGNTHPTVKPTDLMRYLCRLVTPPGGIVLDPFMGSGSTGKAALLEGFDFIGIEREAQYHAIAQQRIGRAAAAGHQPSLLLA